MATPAEGLRQGGPVNISVEALRHVYKGGTVALDGVDLSFGTGLFGLLGPNGAGKSTLMRIMCTLLVPSAGRVTVGGHDVVLERRAVRDMLGYLPQEFGAWRLHRVEEVLDTLALLSGMVVAGTWLGSRLLDRVSEPHFVLIYRVVLTVIALRLVLVEAAGALGLR